MLTTTLHLATVAKYRTATFSESNLMISVKIHILVDLALLHLEIYAVAISTPDINAATSFVGGGGGKETTSICIIRRNIHSLLEVLGG